MPEANPYKGPVAFEENDSERFFGRTEEARELTSLVIARRAVLLYAQSGAGKTSLLQAGVIPELKRRKRLEVLPIARVAGGAAADAPNIYLENLQAKIGEAIGRPSIPHLLIIDQFEEIFTFQPELHSQRRAFFEQLAAWLSAYAQLSLLLSMREDYLADLDSYAGLLPDRVRTRMRLERLTYLKAVDAIRGPAALAGRPFATGVAEELADNLRAGDKYVEPVQLQIVCQQLWSRLPAGKPDIDATDVKEHADVDDALTKFYRDAIVAAESPSVSERALREWFGRRLITPARTRGLVYQGKKDTEGLPNAAVDSLRDSYIVRAEIRGNNTWYELAHDRLIEPILEDNQNWRAAYRNPVAEAYERWVEASRAADRLLTGNQLHEARVYAVQHGSQLSPEELAFLETSADEEKKGRARRRNLVLAGAAVVLALSAVTTLALLESRKARQHLILAAWQSVALQAIIDLADHADNDRSALLARQALRFHVQTPDQPRYLVERALQTAISQTVFAHAFVGHQDAVMSVAFAPDGNRLASASWDKTVRVWDLRQPNASPQVLSGHQRIVMSVTFAPDGNRLASASWDKTVRVWDLRQPNAPPQVLSGHQDRVWCVAFAPDGNRLASASSDKTVRMWDLRQPNAPPQVLAGHQGAVISVAFAPDGNRVASASADKTVRVWDLRRPNAPPQVLSGHQGDVNSVALAPDGNHLASASDDKSVRVWDLRQPNAPPQVLSGHQGGVGSVAFARDGNRLASPSADKTVRVWDLRQPNAPPQVLSGHQGAVYSAAFAPDGNRLASASQDKSVRVWDLRQPNAPPQVLSAHRGGVNSVAFAPDVNRLASGSDDKTVRVWDIRQPNSPSQVLSGHQGFVRSVAFAPDGNRLASASSDKTVRVWDIRQPDAVLRVLSGHQDRVSSVAFGPDGNRLASASSDKTVRVWNLRRPNAPPQVLSGHQGVSYSVAFAPDGNRLVSASDDRTVRVWDMRKPNALPQVLSGSQDFVYSVAFAPDGNRLASASPKIVRVWDMRQPNAPPQVLSGHQHDVISVAFAPDGNRLASASIDKTVRVWDLRQPNAPPQVLSGHQLNVNSVAFSPDGNRLASGSTDGTIRVWPLWSAAADYLCTRVWRNLSMEEWKFYIGEGIPYERTCPALPPGFGAPGGPK